MLLSPSQVCLFVPPGLKKFKLHLFERIASEIERQGGSAIRGNYDAVGRLPDEVIPIIGCTPQFRDYVRDWQARGREWIYWDRGYARRVFATWLPRGEDGGYYRWHRSAFQARRVRDVPDDRWRALLPGNLVDSRPIEVSPWSTGGSHVVVADTGHDYWDLHASRSWTADCVVRMRTLTDRQIVVRDKECKIDLREQLRGAHALVTHGSIAAVESVIMGVPVFVHESSAAALVGETDLTKIESPARPDRERWLHSLAYDQFSESELVDGTLWRLLS